MDVVGHEEAAAVEIIAQDLALFFGQAPFAGLDRVNERVVVDVVAVFEIDDLLHRTRIHARQAPHGFQKMPVGARIILGPQRSPAMIVRIFAPPIAVQRSAGEHDPARKRNPSRDPSPGEGESIAERVFHPRVFAERLIVKRANSVPTRTSAAQRRATYTREASCAALCF